MKLSGLPCVALLVLVSASVARADPFDAVIWSSEKTVADASAKLAVVKTGLEKVGLRFEPTWPAVIQSDSVEGLKPGWGVLLIGYCRESSAVLAAAKLAGKQAYVRKVELTEEQAAAARCPTLTARERRVAVITGIDKNRLTVEKRLDAWRPLYPKGVGFPIA